MFKKIGESIQISRIENTDSCVPAVNQDILANFKKLAADLKKIAPKAEDFLYFSAVMMHAAEASSINEDGSPKLTPSGEQVKVSWDQKNDSWKWVCNDKNILPYKNSNADIFPESELVKAYKKWVGKPLCIDHKSSSVDHVRGFIVDTYYDRNLKRVIALCALDKSNYPDLARKVATGYSNNVSMGTAVGRAICSDCGRVARTEQDFCDHMKNKSCYGEINIDLNPIELSIVVNGADPKAHIKHIIASANTLNNYVASKEKELNKLANTYTATLSMDSSDSNNETTAANLVLKSQDLESLERDIKSAIENFKKIEESFNDSGKDNASDQLTETNPMDNTVSSNNTDFGLAPPHARLASSTETEANLISEFKKITSSIEDRLSHLQASFNKLASVSDFKPSTSKVTETNIEENMTESNMRKKGYFQGAGDENEPTPGETKYPKDPTNEKLRTDGDKHMDVDDIGPVDGMHPGPNSVNMSELERKKMLARAQSEERTMKRNAIVTAAKQGLEQKKQAYFQGGGGANEPTPGKTKYPVDKLQDDLREDSDKQMVGQKPFPGVGAVDGLHPSPNSSDTSDEKKRKEMLQRASLRARFVKAANNDGTQNFGKSSWQVFQGDKLLLTASVNELSGNRSEFLYDSIATKEFGTKLIEKIKVQGVNKVRSLVKSAQTPPPAPPPAPPVDAAPPVDMPPMEGEPAEGAPAEDAGGSGDLKERALELSDKAKSITSDLSEVVRELVGQQKEMGDKALPPEAPPAEAMPPEGAPMQTSASTRTLNVLRKELNGALIHAMKESIAELNDHRQELNMIVDMYDKGTINESNKELAVSIIGDSLNEAKSAVADGLKLITAFVKYARGTQAIVKRAEIESELQALASDGDEPMNDEISDLVNETDSDLSEIGDALKEEEGSGLFGDERDEKLFEDDTDVDLEDMLGKDSDGEEPIEPDDHFDDDNDAMVTGPVKKDELANLPVGTEFKDAKVATVQDRAQLRAKLAAEALKTSPHLHEAHPKGSGSTQLDVKPSGDLGVVEDLEDEHDAMMDVATAPPKVRKEAEAIHRLITAGQLDPKDLNSLIAEGLDKDAVAYYKKYFSQVDGGSEFASELVKEHAKAEMEEELNKYRVKLARAYELAYEMVERELCHNDRIAISSQVDEIMKFNDDSFDSLKRVVARHNPVLSKNAGRMPQVGLIGGSDTNTSSDDNLVAQLSAALSTTSKKMF